MPHCALLPCWFCVEIDVNYITHEYALSVMRVGIWPCTLQENSRPEEGRSDCRWVSVPSYPSPGPPAHASFLWLCPGSCLISLGSGVGETELFLQVPKAGALSPGPILPH